MLSPLSLWMTVETTQLQCFFPLFTLIVCDNGFQSGVQGPQGSLRGIQGLLRKRGIIIFTIILSISDTMSESLTILVMGFIHFL